MHIPPSSTRSLIAAVALTFGLAAAGASASAQTLPGAGVLVQPLKSSIAEETFQTQLVMAGLEKLGYDVKPIKEIEYATAHLAIGNGDATFLADHWNPMHADFYKNAGGDAKLVRKGVYSDNAAQGYLIDKKTADGNHRGDDDHRQRQHQRLVNAGHDGRHGQRQLHFEQHLQW